MSNLITVPQDKNQLLLQAKADAQLLCKNLTNLKVVDDETQKHAEKALAAVKVQADEIESLRTSISKPINDWLKEWKARADDAKSPLEVADKHLRAELRSRQNALAAIREVEARKIEAERQAALKAAEAEKAKLAIKQKEAEEAMAFFGCDDPGGEVERAALVKQAEHDQKMAEIALQSEAKLKASQAANSVAGARKIWKFEVTELDKVPREFLVIDEKAVREFGKLNEYQQEIPGITFFQETVIAAGR
jgi:hypothetical protein